MEDFRTIEAGEAQVVITTKCSELSGLKLHREALLGHWTAVFFYHAYWRIPDGVHVFSVDQHKFHSTVFNNEHFRRKVKQAVQSKREHGTLLGTLRDWSVWTGVAGKLG
jgi:hypothetical protein